MYLWSRGSPIIRANLVFINYFEIFNYDNSHLTTSDIRIQIGTSSTFPRSEENFEGRPPRAFINILMLLQARLSLVSGIKSENVRVKCEKSAGLHSLMAPRSVCVCLSHLQRCGSREEVGSRDLARSRISEDFSLDLCGFFTCSRKSDCSGLFRTNPWLPRIANLKWEKIRKDAGVFDANVGAFLLVRSRERSRDPPCATTR